METSQLLGSGRLLALTNFDTVLTKLIPRNSINPRIGSKFGEEARGSAAALLRASSRNELGAVARSTTSIFRRLELRMSTVAEDSVAVEEAEKRGKEMVPPGVSLPLTRPEANWPGSRVAFPSSGSRHYG